MTEPTLDEAIAGFKHTICCYKPGSIWEGNYTLAIKALEEMKDREGRSCHRCLNIQNIKEIQDQSGVVYKVVPPKGAEMTKEWEELKLKVNTQLCDYQRELNHVNEAGLNCTAKGNYEIKIATLGDVLDRMLKIERRTLPERVARLIASFDHDSWEEENRQTLPAKWSAKFGVIVERALLTGSTIELERWQK